MALHSIVKHLLYHIDIVDIIHDDVGSISYWKATSLKTSFS